MSRIGVAFSSFFGLLFRGTLPPEAALYLPPEAAPPGPPPALPPVAVAPPPTTGASDRPSGPSSAASSGASRADGALVLLGLLQREGRLVDFLRESLEQHPDAAIGAAVRDVHRGCRKVLEEHVRLE